MLVGTLYPLALEQFTGAKISVGAPFFNLSAGTLLLATTFLTPFGFSLSWKRGDLLGVAQRLSVALAGGVATLVALLAATRGGPVLAPIAAALAVFVMLGSIGRSRRARVARRARPRLGAAPRARLAAVVLGRRAGAFRRRRCCCSASPPPASARRRSWR